MKKIGKGGIKCPECGARETYVKDSRDSIVRGTDLAARRRRHECLWCDHRWTTYEVNAIELLTTLSSFTFKKKKLTGKRL